MNRFLFFYIDYRLSFAKRFLEVQTNLKHCPNKAPMCWNIIGSSFEQ